MSQFSCEIVEHLGVLSRSEAGWTKELNLVSFGGHPKYDLREWSPDHKRMSKGIRLSREELTALAGFISKIK